MYLRGWRVVEREARGGVGGAEEERGGWLISWETEPFRDFKLLLQQCRALYNWCIHSGLIPRSPWISWAQCVLSRNLYTWSTNLQCIDIRWGLWDVTVGDRWRSGRMRILHDGFKPHLRRDTERHHYTHSLPCHKRRNQSTHIRRQCLQLKKLSPETNQTGTLILNLKALRKI